MDKPNAGQQLASVSQVAEICGISAEHVRRLADRGAMPAPVRLGRSVRFRLAEIEAWMQAGCPDRSANRFRH